MKGYYKISQCNSTLCGYPAREFDWNKLCWDGSQIHKGIFKREKDMQAPLPLVDDCLIPSGCQYLHVPYNFAEEGTIYRLRPNSTMYAGRKYRGKIIKRQTAVKRKGIWYWCLEFVC